MISPRLLASSGDFEPLLKKVTNPAKLKAVREVVAANAPRPSPGSPAKPPPCGESVAAAPGIRTPGSRTIGRPVLKGGVREGEETAGEHGPRDGAGAREGIPLGGVGDFGGKASRGGWKRLGAQPPGRRGKGPVGGE